MSDIQPKHFRPKTNFLSANYKEVVWALLGIVLVLFARFAVQSADPTAGVTDYGALDTVIFAMCALSLAYLYTWGLLRVAFKTFHLYLDGKGFRKDFFEKLNPNVRIAAALVVILCNVLFLIELTKVFTGTK